MTWFLVILAEAWRLRGTYGLAILLGLGLGVTYTYTVPPTFEARALLQVRNEQARPPMLRQMTAPGQERALWQVLTNGQLLHDTGLDAKRTLLPRDIRLNVINNNLMAVTYQSTDRMGIEQVTDSLAFNFIQALLAPERMRIEAAILQNKEELKELAGRLATSDGADSARRPELEARQTKLQDEIVQMQSDLRQVNLSLGANSNQTLVWFAEPASLIPPLEGGLLLLRNMTMGLLMGVLLGWLAREVPSRRRPTVMTADDVTNATGMPLIGIIPWLGKLTVTLQGLRVQSGGKQLKPHEFSELGRLHRALLRNLRGPLVVLGVEGDEGTTSLAMMLAERTAAQGKSVALVDMNLKDRTLSHWLGLGEGNWELPSKTAKKRWDALHSLPGHDNIHVLAAPLHPETLSKLGESGGLPALFDQLSGMADVVIVDASPLGAANRGNIDAVAVAAASGRTVLIAQATTTGTTNLKRAADGLLLVGAPLIGIVLNNRHHLTRRQLLGQMADCLGRVLPFVGKAIRKGTLRAKLD